MTPFFIQKLRIGTLIKTKVNYKEKKNVEKSGKCQMKNKLCWKITGAAGGSGNKKCANTAEGGGLGNQLKDN